MIDWSVLLYLYVFTLIGNLYENHNCIYNENTDKCVSTCNSNLSYAVDSNDNGNCVNCSHGYFPIQRNFNRS